MQATGNALTKAVTAAEAFRTSYWHFDSMFCKIVMKSRSFSAVFVDCSMQVIKRRFKGLHQITELKTAARHGCACIAKTWFASDCLGSRLS